MAIYDPITVARFWSKANVGARSACWEWKAGRLSDGYGKFKISGKDLVASRSIEVSHATDATIRPA